MRLIAYSLVGLILVPAARAGEKQKSGDKPFTIEGRLAKDDPADKIRKSNPHQAHPYTMKAGSVYLIKMTSKNPKELDNFLRLEDSAGRNLAEDDDSGGWPNARIIFKAPKDDDYRIIATAYSGTGEYTITVQELSPKDLEGQLGVAFGESLRTQYEARYQRGDKDDKLLAEAELSLKHVAQQQPSLASRIKEVQFALRHLTVGRTAMEIEAEDLDGKPFKLSDYRGKVVVLDFWGNW
jgi:AhpC/TSA family